MFGDIQLDVAYSIVFVGISGDDGNRWKMSSGEGIKIWYLSGDALHCAAGWAC
ncbi:MAG: hypothetical protein KIT36_10940 [Alphaproteobacteria bacterium]|nr:hypothetical protein [Alphaproteobacteria bacterium]